MARFRVHTTTTSRTTCEQCPNWVCPEISIGAAQSHVLKTGHTVTRLLTKETTVSLFGRGNENGQQGSGAG